MLTSTVCPVKIFKAGSQPGTVDIVEDNVDECTLRDRSRGGRTGPPATWTEGPP